VTKRKRILWWLTGAAIVVGSVTLIILPRSPSEPLLQGRPLTEWLKEIDSDFPNNSPKEKSQRAVAAIRQDGQRCLPYLIRMLKRRDSWLKDGLMEYKGGDKIQKLMKLRLSPEIINHRYACRGLAALGPMAEPAMPVLVEHFHEGDTDGSEAALAAIGPPAFAVLKSGLIHPNRDVRVQALQAFAVHFPTNHLASAIQVLTNVVSSHTDEWMRRRAAIGLANLHQQSDLAVPVLLVTMEAAGKYSAEAVKALLNFPNKAKEHVPEIRRLAQKTNDPLARNAAEAVLKRLELGTGFVEVE
jgi:HEAT repeat protein